MKEDAIQVVADTTFTFSNREYHKGESLQVTAKEYELIKEFVTIVKNVSPAVGTKRTKTVTELKTK